MNPSVKEALETDCGHGACALLEKKDPNNLIELLDVVNNPDHYTERALLNATYLLGRWGDERAVAPITARLTELDEKGQICALDALGRIGKHVDVEVVARFGKSENPDVRKFAFKALSRIGGSVAKTKLEELNVKEQVPWVKKIGEMSIKHIAPQAR